MINKKVEIIRKLERGIPVHKLHEENDIVKLTFKIFTKMKKKNFWIFLQTLIND